MQGFRKRFFGFTLHQQWQDPTVSVILAKLPDFRGAVFRFPRTRRADDDQEARTLELGPNRFGEI